MNLLYQRARMYLLPQENIWRLGQGAPSSTPMPTIERACLSAYVSRCLFCISSRCPSTVLLAIFDILLL